MAKRISQVNKKLSDKKLTIDKNGRLRIGGRFASKAQVGRWTGARRRRGLTVTPAPSVPRKANKRRSLTNAASLNGLTFIKEVRLRDSDAVSKLKRIYQYDQNPADTESRFKQAIIDAASREKLSGDRVLINGVVRGQFRGADVAYAFRFVLTDDPGFENDVFSSVTALLNKYQLDTLTGIDIIFSFAKARD